jgi:hypothetical protein
MYRIRTTKTSSGAVAVQVVEYKKNCRKILLHVGSSKDSSEVEGLKQIGLKWIEENNPQRFLFSLVPAKSNSTLISLDKLEYRGFSYRLLYETLSSIATIFKYHLIPESLILNDLVITRITKPYSKSESFEFMRDYFDVSYSRRDFYRVLNNFSVWKDDALKRTISVAKKHFGFSFSFVFYDLTTLYFESFETDDLRKVGFSKDNKSANPQIMIGLMVDDNGFPVYYQVFPGNKFEGHTLMPSLEC